MGTKTRLLRYFLVSECVCSAQVAHVSQRLLRNKWYSDTRVHSACLRAGLPSSHSRGSPGPRCPERSDVITGVRILKTARPGIWGHRADTSEWGSSRHEEKRVRLQVPNPRGCKGDAVGGGQGSHSAGRPDPRPPQLPPLPCRSESSPSLGHCALCSPPTDPQTS